MIRYLNRTLIQGVSICLVLSFFIDMTCATSLAVAQENDPIPQGPDLSFVKGKWLLTRWGVPWSGNRKAHVELDCDGTKVSIAKRDKPAEVDAWNEYDATEVTVHRDRLKIEFRGALSQTDFTFEGRFDANTPNRMLGSLMKVNGPSEYEWASLEMATLERTERNDIGGSAWELMPSYKLPDTGPFIDLLVKAREGDEADAKASVQELREFIRTNSGDRMAFYAISSLLKNASTVKPTREDLAEWLPIYLEQADRNGPRYRFHAITDVLDLMIVGLDDALLQEFAVPLAQESIATLENSFASSCNAYERLRRYFALAYCLDRIGDAANAVVNYDIADKMDDQLWGATINASQLARQREMLGERSGAFAKSNSPQIAILEGTVRDANGSPRSGVGLSFIVSYNVAGGTTTSDENGRFHVEFPFEGRRFNVRSVKCEILEYSDKPIPLRVGFLGSMSANVDIPLVKKEAIVDSANETTK
jgi:hypothetical protein